MLQMNLSYGCKKYTESFLKLKCPCQYNFMLQNHVKIIYMKKKDTKGFAYNNWMYLEINIPDIDSFCLTGSHILHHRLSQEPLD